MLSIVNKTRRRTPALPFGRIKNVVLGQSFTVSLVFAGDRQMRTLNRVWRKKDYPANVLAFPLADKHGEIFISLARARREKDPGQNTGGRAAFLFIHALLHLKGFRHGITMERKEHKLYQYFLTRNEQKNRYRDRRRHGNRAYRRLRI